MPDPNDERAPLKKDVSPPQAETRSSPPVIVIPSHIQDEGKALGAVFYDSLYKIVEAEREGKPLSGGDPAMNNFYSSLSRKSEKSIEDGASSCLTALGQLYPDTQIYNAVWTQFHTNIARLDQTGETLKATKFLERAILLNEFPDPKNKDVAPKDKPLEKTKPDVTEIIKNISTETLTNLLSKLPEQESPAELPAFLKTPGQPILFEEADKKRSGMDNEQKSSKELLNEYRQPRQGQKPSAQWVNYNWSKYFNHIDELSQKNPIATAQELGNLLINPILKTSPWKDMLWDRFGDVIAKLSDQRAENAYPNIKAANRELTLVFDLLPKDDPHRAMIRNLLASNGYNTVGINDTAPLPTALPPKEDPINVAAPSSFPKNPTFKQ